ncbi:hypothetical protein IEQ34_021177 [Dendrobium chrysotoxum]|uniref:Uncharacterized protein n=1 Tax=Dendrobium chrysotoxum TaxID=161865 RepID=A0AAV7G420_DENCH|nr:hypothetical protein IEQ34_021177 [Dendrobium chrysotoxum]
MPILAAGNTSGDLHLLHLLPLPLPLPAKHLFHILQTPPSRLRQKHIKKHPPAQRYSRVHIKTPCDTYRLIQGNKRHRHHATHHPISRRPHTRSLRPQPQREYLRTVNPRYRPQSYRKRPNKRQNGRYAHTNRRLRRLAFRLPVDYKQRRSQRQERDYHPTSAA